MQSAVKTDWKKLLNESQLQAVEYTEGPSIIIAGAGSGKTRTLTFKVLNLIEKGANPDEILLLTFTNKAANEMIERIKKLLPYDISDEIFAGTFHKIGNYFLRKYSQYIGISNDYSILDRSDSESIMEKALKSANAPIKEKNFPGKKLLTSIMSLAKNSNCDVEEIIIEKYQHFEEHIEIIKKTVSHYEKIKKESNAIDFDDMLILWLRLLKDSRINQKIKSLFKYVLIDEYQDTNKIQSDIADELVSETQNITVVGDDSQSIYSFRGAHFENILTFSERYKNAKIFKLEINYRSTKEILELANALISKNKFQHKKRLVPASKANGPLPTLINYSTAYEQAEDIANKIKNLISKGKNPSEIAVLYRSHYHSMELQMELTRKNINFKVHSGLKFFELAHIKTLTSFLKASTSTKDLLSWGRIIGLVAGIGPKTQAKILEHLKNYDIPSDITKEIFSYIPKKSKEEFEELLSIILEITKIKKPSESVRLIIESNFFNVYMKKNFQNYDERFDDCWQFHSFSEKFETLKTLIDELTLVSTNDEYEDSPKKGIILSSIHQAKGLEWETVFIIWLCEGKFPVIKKSKDPMQIEEERRLFYVAITRAKKNLYLTFPSKDTRNQYGFERYLNPSRFIMELPPHLYNEEYRSQYY